MAYHPGEIELKWQKRWADAKLAEIDVTAPGEKFYMLNMFPYPSGDLHVGHGRNYILGDALYRYFRMQGRAALNPMGWDAFGLPAENAAIKRGIHPREWTLSNIAREKKQFERWGILYDWSKELASCDPEYYRWNQWLFLQLYKRGLAYRGTAPVNWCPQDLTVLANEQVIDGRCERCGSIVEQRELSQWFFKITDYADRLDADLDRLGHWPEKVKVMQRNWIGRSIGADVDFPVSSLGCPIRVFTTRPDTIFGATFMVLAPEHPDVPALIADHPERAAIEEWINGVRNQSNLERQESGKEGRFTGEYAINPFTNEEIPIWLGNFVLMQYGTGAIMSVPAHDQRDFEFAKQYGLPIRVVIQPSGGQAPPPVPTGEAPVLHEAFTVKDDSAVIINSGLITGLTPPNAIERISDEIERRGIGKKTIRYRLRDWLISRQRYWGTPIPMIYCDRCGLVPVPERDLPVTLPLDVPFTGREGNPLAKHEAFVNVQCPQCGGAALRETDTMDTFVDSSWYYARFISSHDSTKIFDSKLVNRWLPVDQYIGGIEHAILHLLYARFICRTLHDLGLTQIEEPFLRLFNQGVITKEGYRDPSQNMNWVPLDEVEIRHGKAYRGQAELVAEVGKMSKSRFNVVPPDELIEKYGADTERVYTLFIAPPEKEAAWSDEGVIGAYRFLGRVWNMGTQIIDIHTDSNGTGDIDRVIRKMHQTIDGVTRRFERFEFNTAISSLMELSNAIGEYLAAGGRDGRIREVYTTLLQMLHPFAPHLTEEIWEMYGQEGFILTSKWPVADPSLMREDVVTIVVQVNGKLRGQIEVPNPPVEDVVMAAVRSNEKIQNWVAGKEIVKTIYVPGKLVNVVVR
ncbi:MAG TPA: leucine--tRNA ligase [Thermoanaerobaculia bacterium]|jgi:leucyl-tRNA synthetase|nr:leucine--tRNA ligase [Thermoanaerobaculia bacterium]